MGYTIYGRPRPQKGSCGDSFFCQPTVQQYELSIIRTDMCCQYIRRKFFFVKLTYNSKTLKKNQNISTVSCQYHFLLVYIFLWHFKIEMLLFKFKKELLLPYNEKKSSNLQILPFANKCISLEVQYLGKKFRCVIIKKI